MVTFGGAALISDVRRYSPRGSPVSGRSLENFIGWLNTYHPTRSYLLDQFKISRQMVRAREHWMWDASGARYLDFLSQYGVVSFGHSHPDLVRALRDALDEELPAFSQPMVPVAAQQLADRLRDIAPGDLAHTVFTNSGAEAPVPPFGICNCARTRTPFSL